MLRSLYPSLRKFVSTSSLSIERFERSTVVILTPDVGLRWGKPADLVLNADRPSKTIWVGPESDEEQKRIYNEIEIVQLASNFQRVAIRENDGGGLVSVRRIHSMNFNHAETLDQTHTARWLTKWWSYNLTFSLHPETETEE